MTHRNDRVSSASMALSAMLMIAIPASAAETLPCDGLAGWTGATEEGGGAVAKVDATEVKAANGATPAHCRVSGTIDTEIHFELLLPEPTAWNGRFVMGGGGGFVGSIQNTAMEPMIGGNALQRGFATVGTDTGHRGIPIDASWALDNDERERNFADRAVHLTAVFAKQLVNARYGRAAERSYFIGCSRGGGQAMIESQRYPEDFDGIVAMAPAFSWARIGAAFVQHQQLNLPDPGDLSKPTISTASRALLARAIDERCDALDGVEDDILTDPRKCDFDPASLLCEGQAGDDCLSSEQLAAVERIYEGPVVDGESIFVGYPFGAEAPQGGWDTWTTGVERPASTPVPNLHYAFGTQLFKYLVFDDPDFDYTDYDFSTFFEDTAEIDALLSAHDTDLRPFREAGGKLLFWHGWSDPALSALATIGYYEKATANDPSARDDTRLFLAPGVLHCAGGPGPDRSDLLGAIVAWVETGEAPDRLLAQKIGPGGEPVLSRPLCAYPQVAVWDGSGDPAMAESFDCQVP